VSGPARPAAHHAQAAADYQVVRTYLEWLADLPWDKSTEDNLDIERAEEILDADHHDLEKVKRRVLDFLAVRKLKKESKGPILCFVGRQRQQDLLGQSIARALVASSSACRWACGTRPRSGGIAAPTSALCPDALSRRSAARPPTTPS
jgi:ATP-dependent Lon protease